MAETLELCAPKLSRRHAILGTATFALSAIDAAAMPSFAREGATAFGSPFESGFPPLPDSKKEVGFAKTLMFEDASGDPKLHTPTATVANKGKNSCMIEMTVSHGEATPDDFIRAAWYVDSRGDYWAVKQFSRGDQVDEVTMKAACRLAPRSSRGFRARKTALGKEAR